MSQFKPGDLVAYKWLGGDQHRMVVEQVFARGMVEHCLCSYVDRPIVAPIMAASMLIKIGEAK